MYLRVQCVNVVMVLSQEGKTMYSLFTTESNRYYSEISKVLVPLNDDQEQINMVDY